MSQDLKDHLKSLHTSEIDARNGYERALEDAEKREDLSGLFRDMMSLHQANADDLGVLLAQMGELADADGSFMSGVHRTIMDVRSLFGGLDESVLPGLIDGEKRNKARYDEALKISAGRADITAALTSQQTKISEAIGTMQALQPS